MKKRLAKGEFAARIGMAGAFASAMLFAAGAWGQDARLSLADRVARLEQQAQSQSQGGVGMVNQMQQLQEQVRSLQGQVEELRHEVQQLQEKSKVQYIDLDSRLSRLEGNGAGTPQNNSSATGPASASSAAEQGAAPAGATSAAADGGGTAKAAAPADPAQVQAAYDAAFRTLQDGNFVQASRSFRDFIQQYPDSGLAPNAYYWLGESYYSTMNYSVALDTFKQLVQRYPDSPKAPDAMLKAGYSQLELKQAGPGKSTLQTVVSKYPGSSAARLAQERLRRLQLQSVN